MPIVGNPAPDFEAQAYYKGEFVNFKLSDKRGQWVYLLFYPLDFTFVCPTEILAFSKKAEEFRARNCEVVGISVDSHFVHKAWAETERAKGGLGGVDIPLVADLDKSISKSYDVLAGAVALRGLFLIDPEGVVQHATINNLAVGRSTTEAMRVLKAFQFVQEHAGEVCPADWDEGVEPMKASPEAMAEYLATRID
ncbi:MAG: peroxiredoxin [Planctomycetota bacterium]|nr:MAG: peroxiredoxin [Planctomycetota bacterium]